MSFFKNKPLNNYTLYSYVVETDDGSAPNPFGGYCSLAICKPDIRKSAKVGDWVIGTGSKNSPIGDIRKKVIYMMKITKIISLEEYDNFADANCPNKIPNWDSDNLVEKVGDCIYFYENNKPSQRKSVHNESHIKIDLKGMNVLLSDHFYYFGDQAIELPVSLHGIIKKGQKHKSVSNTTYIKALEEWLKSDQFDTKGIFGKPIDKVKEHNKKCSKC